MNDASLRQDSLSDIEALENVGEIAVSPHRNLVTKEGLAQIEAKLEAARAAVALGEKDQNRLAIAIAMRDLNYWSARRANAELVHTIADKSEARFGMTITVKTAKGETASYRIVGEDEADPAKGLIPHVAPLAIALLGKSVGDSVEVKHEKAKIISIA